MSARPDHDALDVLRLSWRMTLRDWRAGELRFLLLALLLAVAAISSVGFFVDRLRNGLERNALQLLGGDLLVSADQPLPPTWRSEARRRGLQVAETVVFPSMAISAAGTAKLVALKAVTPGYPLRGQLKLLQDGKEVATRSIPTPGTVWLDPALMSALDIAVGATLRLGDASFVVAERIGSEPDRGAAFMNFAPRALIAAADLEATHLIQNGSRVTYRIQLAGPDQPVRQMQAWVQDQIAAQGMRGVHLESLESGRPEMRATLDRAAQFLAVVSLLSAMLAAVAVAMAARRFMLRHLDACAMLRCLGLTQAQATCLYLFEFLLLGLAGSGAGVMLGFTGHFVLLNWLGDLAGTDLPLAGWLPAWQGLATGLLLLTGFSLPPLLQLRNVPHNRVIRREQTAPQALGLLSYGLGLAMFVALLVWQCGDAKIGLLIAAGFLLGLLLFAVVARLCVAALGALRAVSAHTAWRFALTAMQRRSFASVVQIVALALGLMALLLLSIVRADLLAAWRQATPANAPNQFVINILPDQKDEIAARIERIAPAELYPMIRGRLIEVNGKTVSPLTYPDERARKLVEREFNLSTMRELPAQNTIVAGRWYRDLDGEAEASVELGIAKNLNLKIGDTLTFDMAGQSKSVRVTSLRKLDWSSMRVNFFVIINPKAMSDTAQTWITAFHLPAARADFVNRLTRDFPNLTVVDVGMMVRQVQSVLDQVTGAVQFLFVFTLASGVLVLYAALLGTQDERVREAALLRALGATRRQLSLAQWIEFSLCGGLAGLLAAAGASATGWALAHFIFEFDWIFDARVWLLGAGAGIMCAVAGGWFGLRKVVTQSPLSSLREA